MEARDTYPVTAANPPPRALHGMPTIVEACLQHGADPSSEDAYGFSPRAYADARLLALSQTRSYNISGTRMWAHRSTRDA